AGTVVVSNDNWFNDQQGTAVASASAAIGAFAFSEPASKDAAVITTLAPGSYTILVSGMNGSTGIALVEVYDLSMIGPPSINVSATARTDSATSRLLGTFTISRTGSTGAPLTVHFTLEGTANAGFDYAGVPYYVVIPAGANYADVEIKPLGTPTTPQFVSDRTVQLRVNPNAEYQLGSAPSALFVIPGIRPTPTPTPSPTPTLRPTPTPSPSPTPTPSP
ncbi:MAG TPA: hypothetical protein PLN52_23945, partial [Opitutaceae bacterium]|nr:hypothetical protein [Opitutaceae bacterium]